LRLFGFQKKLYCGPGLIKADLISAEIADLVLTMQASGRLDEVSPQPGISSAKAHPLNFSFS